MINDVRQSQLIAWLSDVFSADKIHLLTMNGDAGFRRYFRFNHKEQSYIAVDSPQKWCNNVAFTKVQHLLMQADIQVPEIVVQNEGKGFFCLSDLGDTLLGDIVNLDNMHVYYQQAIDLLPRISSLQCDNFPVFDESFIQTELSIFVEWLLSTHLSIELSEVEAQKLKQCFDVLTASALTQPKVTVHRDFHSRNIMQTADKKLAVIDFQDAVHGPITYDIVSLLRDCYLKWPNEKVHELFNYYINLQATKYNLTGISAEQWRTWFDLMGIQRHLKASGIFARLYHRDNKPGYLKDIPLTLSYIVEVSKEYDSLKFLADLVSQKVLPKLAGISPKGIN
ncbi:aminoglycoside phosphotransferase family protein [Thalassotalea piscium]|uniref:Aminoglycoside phosphotransferase domain-containing protein n=1 Tax=Thalassotalea piscium TaxID=1230533 RepID=A0A7X0NE50_9GAMM|nr:phosphotransferase [Thalassotalea piscium]MBB6541656.1 hypothetical protein [Thalassotalea piscium]